MKEGAPLGPYQFGPSKNWVYTADQGRSEGFFAAMLKPRAALWINPQVRSSSEWAGCPRFWLAE